MPDQVYNVQAAYNWAIRTCNASNVGYAGGSAPDAVPASWRDMQLHDGKRYCDCSSFIWFAVIAGGIDLASIYGSTWPFVTYDMGGVLTQAGFQWFDSSQEPWIAGDIVVFPGDSSQGTGHTEMVYDNNYVTMGAHNSYLPFADQVSINNYSSSSSTYPDLYRWTGGGPTPPIPPHPGRRAPIWLIKRAKEVNGWL